jgi:hypothetical protein
MFEKKCPSCGAKARLNDGHFGHKVHKAHHIIHLVQHTAFFKNNPIGATIGAVVLTGVGLVELFEKHSYLCDAGHSFKA